MYLSSWRGSRGEALGAHHVAPLALASAIVVVTLCHRHPPVRPPSPLELQPLRFGSFAPSVFLTCLSVHLALGITPWSFHPPPAMGGASRQKQTRQKNAAKIPGRLSAHLVSPLLFLLLFVFSLASPCPLGVAIGLCDRHRPLRSPSAYATVSDTHLTLPTNREG